MTKWTKTKHPGVRYKESASRSVHSKPERYYSIRYSREGKGIEEGVGWESAGVTASYASNLRNEITQNIRSGSGFQSLKEKREIEAKRKRLEQAEEDEKRKLNIPFDDLAQKYLEWAESNKKSWRDDKGRYEFHIQPAIGNLPLSQISMITLEKLKSDLKKKPVHSRNKKKNGKSSKRNLSDATIKQVLVLIRQMFNRGIAWGIYEGPNPVSETTKQDKKFLRVADNKRTRFLSRQEADELLDAVWEKSHQTHDICLLSLYSGMRVGEIFNLRWSDVDLNHGIIHVKDPKSGQGRTAYITDPIRGMLDRRKGEGVGASELIFKNSKGGKIREISNLLDRVIRDTGLNKDITDRRDRVVAHTLRHTFASWLVQDGVPLATVQKLMGHASIIMTVRYSHLSPSHEREAAMSLVQVKEKVVEISETKKKRKK